MQFLMCAPDYFGIEYEINPWMDVRKKTNQQAVEQQWRKLYDTMLECGAEVKLISPVKNWPDLVFTANAGLFYLNKIFLSHFKFKERQGEEPYFSDWFQKSGYEIFYSPNHNRFAFEGAGDALPLGDKLFVAYGFRSERRYYEEAPFDQHKLVFCELTDPYFYHLDTCFCPLNANTALWYPPAFSKDSQKMMSAQAELISVSEREAKRFACNAVVINKNIIMPTECPKIYALLEDQGYKIHVCNMDEFLKSGGACKCLTMRID